jgi:hypothetical protein
VPTPNWISTSTRAAPRWRRTKAAAIRLVPSHLVAAALGHESFATTARHYAKVEAIESAVRGGPLMLPWSDDPYGEFRVARRGFMLERLNDLL